MAKVISFGIQKGGVGKTTTSGITAWLLSQDCKVLAIDMDSQANLSMFLSGVIDLTEFEDQTIKQAMFEGDVRPYIRTISDTLHYVPSDDYLVLFAEEYRGTSNKYLLLSEALASVQDDYDYIILDLPPALSLETRNALCASSHVVVMFETSYFCYNAIPRFLETVEGARSNFKPDLKVAGVLPTLLDARRSDNATLIETARYKYADLMFETVIKRTASTGRLPGSGFFDNPEVSKAVQQHKEFLRELMERVK